MSVCLRVHAPHLGLSLYRHYDGCLHPQPCYLRLDLESGEAWADYDPEVGAGSHQGAHVPERDAHGVVRRWRIPLMTGDGARRLLAEPKVRELLREVLRGGSVVQDGTDLVGRLDDAGQAASDALEAYLADAEGDMAEVAAEDWFVLPEDLELVTAAMSDRELQALQRRLVKRAWDNPNGHVLLRGTDQFLQRRRDLLRERLAEARS